MGSSNTEHERQACRRRLVEEHIRCENEHDLEGIMATFGEHAEYEDTPWAEHHRGRGAVHDYYHGLLGGLPDLGVHVGRWHMTNDAVILEVTITGTHTGTWRGVPPTGRRVEFPLCAVYTFTDDDRLAGERIYYDRMHVLEQLGLYRDPDTLAARLGVAAAHPVAMVGAVARGLYGRLPGGKRGTG